MRTQTRSQTSARKKNPLAVALGVRGGRARARNLTKAEHVALARHAIRIRWARARQAKMSVAELLGPYLGALAFESPIGPDGEEVALAQILDEREAQIMGRSS
jgi:hypothetical protein